MFQHRIPVLIILVVTAASALVVSVSAQTDTAAITWYTGGDKKLRLEPIPVDTASSLALAGTTSQKTLIVTVSKKNGATRNNPVPLEIDGSFNVLYLIRDGIGTYTITLSGSTQSNSQSYQGLGFFTHAVNKALPANLLSLELNGKIIEYANNMMGTTVGCGECWDLIQEALDKNLADWTRPTSYGRLLNPETDEIKAGDIIQFRSLKITEHLPGGVTKRETIGEPDHTAIIYKTLGNKRYILAHQNVNGKRSVLKGEVNLTKITSGKYWIYRPVALMIKQ